MSTIGSSSTRATEKRATEKELGATKKAPVKGPISLVMHVMMHVHVVVMMMVMHVAGAGGSDECHSEQGSENIGERLHEILLGSCLVTSAG
jgi:hypothetical protein